MTGTERLGRLFEFDVDLLSKKGDLKISEALGKPMSVALSLGEPPARYFNGIIARFSLVDWTGENFRYRAKLRPWMWLMSRAVNSRIFQKKDFATVIDVIKKVFDEHAGDFNIDGVQKGDHPCPEYLVQYQESDLNFVSRLMEQAGIYYFFRHEEGSENEPGKHTLILADGLAHEKVGRYEEIPYFPPNSNRSIDRDHEHIDTWSIGYQVEPGGYAAKEFDFENPRAPLLSVNAVANNHPHADLEVFEYPGRYIPDQQRDAYTVRRRQEQQLGFEVVQGTGNARGMTPGFLFKLVDYPAEEQNKEYLITGASYTLVTNEYGSGGGGDHDEFRCTFSGVDAHVTYRTPVTTPKPEMAGPQTAIVVGIKDQEITTDKYGRVKIQFHWDRRGKFDQDSSCWVRVSQVWAGAKWGAMHIPRIGQEVIVDFLDGDPDRPIITGRVYNHDNMPPYELGDEKADNRTQSGIKSRSTPGGSPSNFNEIRFEDKKGKEEFHVQAERDHSTLVKRNQSISVGADRSVSVGGNESISVNGTRTSTITKKETQTFKDDRMMTVTKTNTDEVTLLHTGTYKLGRTETVSAADDNLTVNGAKKIVTVHGEYNTVADTQFEVMQAGNQFLIKDEIILDNQKCKVDMKDGNTKITAADEIKLECGSASITLKKDGTIEISGSQKVKVDGGGAGVELTAEGAKMSGAKASVSGTSMTEITGGMVKIN